MSNVSVGDIVNSALNAIQESHELYYKWSNGEWLWNAPEYFLTVKIAEKIAFLEKNKLVTMEDNVKFILENANAKGKGKIHQDIRPDGRFDIILWHKNDIPRGVIEVKNSVNDYRKIKKDASRIKKVLERKQDDSKLEFGLIAFYISKQYKANAKNELNKDIEKIFENVKKDIIYKSTLKIKKYTSKDIFCEDDKNAYCAVIFLIEK